MTENQIEEVLQALESASNLMRGLSIDPRLSPDIVEVLQLKANEADDIVEKYA